MLLLTPIIALKLAMLTAIGADALTAVFIAVPEACVGATIGAWLTKRPFAPPNIFKEAVPGGEDLKHSPMQSRIATVASLIIGCSHWLKKIIDKIFGTREE